MKRLIICCDGTWQDSDGGEFEVPTNVTRMTRALKSLTSDGITQIVYYQAGVGTGGTWDKVIGGGTGQGLQENVREAYGFIAHNYHPGDTIHLFGFSRGAYTARSVCGIITHLGVLTKRGMDDFWKIYADYQNNKLEDPAYVAEIAARDSGSWITPNVTVSTIGCWDTVGSLGIPTIPIPLLGRAISGASAKTYAFLNTSLSPSVLHAFHALALDEHRKPFVPTLWHKGSDNTVTDLHQCWFPGVHTNIGGGYADQEIADMTLAWMIQKCAPYLEFNDFYLRSIVKNDSADHTTQWAGGKIYNSATGLMQLSGNQVREPGASDLAGLGPTCETVHVSVRVREQVVKGWKSAAMKGWEWSNADKAWVKGEKMLKEDWLGDLELELAGADIVENLLGWAMPKAAADRIVQSARGNSGKD